VIKIDLGCGPRKKSNKHIGIDIASMPGVDMTLDLEKGKLPFENNSVDEVVASHCLEHIVNYMPLINEVWRVLKPEGRFEVKVPHYLHESAHTDPTHIRRFTPKSFDFFDESKILFKESGWYLSPARFQISNISDNGKEIAYDLRTKKKNILLVGPRNSIHMGRWKNYLNSTSHNVNVASRQMGEHADYQLGYGEQSREDQLDDLPSRLGELLTSHNFDVVHAHFSTRYGHVLNAVPSGTRKVLSVWGEDVLDEANSDNKCREKLIAGIDSADYITTTSMHMQDILVREHGVDKKNIWVIPWGYTENFFPRDVASDHKRLSELGIGSREKIFLSARVCRPNNNIKQLIDGFIDSRVDGKLAVLTGNLQDKTYRERLEAKVSKNENVIFLPTVNEQDLSLLYNKAEATISLPYVDQLSTTVLESLACGTPIVGSRIPVYQERITDGVNGYFVNPDNIAEISKAIRSASESKEKMRAAAIDSVKNDSWLKNANEMLKVYDIPKSAYDIFI